MGSVPAAMLAREPFIVRARGSGTRAALEGLPLMRRWHRVHRASRVLSPAAEAFRYFMLERGEAHLAEMFRPEDGIRSVADRPAQ
jgi:hypothetical protein